MSTRAPEHQAKLREQRFKHEQRLIAPLWLRLKREPFPQRLRVAAELVPVYFFLAGLGAVAVVAFAVLWALGVVTVS